MKTTTRIVVKTTTTTKSDGTKESTTIIETEGDLTLEQIKSVLDRPTNRRNWWEEFWSNGFK